MILIFVLRLGCTANNPLAACPLANILQPSPGTCVVFHVWHPPESHLAALLRTNGVTRQPCRPRGSVSRLHCSTSSRSVFKLLVMRSASTFTSAYCSLSSTGLRIKHRCPSRKSGHFWSGGGARRLSAPHTPTGAATPRANL